MVFKISTNVGNCTFYGINYAFEICNEKKCTGSESESAMALNKFKCIVRVLKINQML